MNKILITGGAGFIGAHLANKLSKSKKNKILVVDSLKSKGGIPYLSPRNKFIKGDITKKKILKKIEKWKPEVIYHLAAQSGSEGAYDNPKEDLLTNALGTYLLAELAKKIKCKKFIYTSTVAVYGNNKKYISERSEIRPDSIYGVSKYAGELFLRQLLINTKVKTYIFRIFNTYGPGENLNNLKKGMVSIYSGYVWKNRKIIVKGSLKRFRDLIYITDCVDILKKSMYIKLKNKDEIFNLSSGIKYDVKTILRKIIKASNKKKNYPIKISKGTLGDSFGFHTKSKKLKKLFKFKANYNLDKGLKFYFQWIKKVPNVKNLKKYHPFEIGKY